MFFLLLSVLVLVACTQEQDPQEPSQEDQTQIEKETDEDALSEEKKKIKEEEVTSNNEKNGAIENDAFRIFEPLPTSDVSTGFSVIGDARVYEGTVRYELQDIQGNVISEGFTTATNGGPEWGSFEISVNYDIDEHTEGTLLIFEESAEDGSRLHEIQIPLQLSNE